MENKAKIQSIEKTTNKTTNTSTTATLVGLIVPSIGFALTVIARLARF